MENERLTMPAEYMPHRGTIMIWPVRKGSWPYGAKKAQEAFTQVIRAIAKREEVWVLYHAQKPDLELLEESDSRGRIHLLDIPTDDAWARDMCPTFVRNAGGDVAGIDWQFNAWGGDYDGLYKDFSMDNACAEAVCRALGIPVVSAGSFVLEGGSIHVDGEGTLITTQECLLSQGRNPALTREQIEDKLAHYLGIQKVIWLPWGIYQDETNGHVDNICAFTAPGKVVLAWTDDQTDPQYARSMADLEVLQNEQDAKGRPFQITKLPIPSAAICMRAEDVKGFVFEAGEDRREAGERLAASYVNFYLANGAVIVPQFADVNDRQAVDILEREFPDRSVIPVMARDILMGGGNIHCITQQVP